jgi:hypothetical protein
MLSVKISGGESETGKMPAISKASIDKVFQKKIYFGHQSVGNNILGGVLSVAQDQANNIINIQDVETINESGPAFFHSRAGRNRDPKSKIDDFRQTIGKRFSGNLDVAFLKFCYVDITKDSDLEEIFRYYKKSLDELKKEFPDITFVHLTVPLKTNNASWKTTVKKWMGKSDLWEYADNIQRNRFNEMILKEYQGKEPVFDLAAVESTRPDGRRETFTFKGETYFALAKEYTSDGGHLNDLGSRKVAAALLESLAEI